MMENFLKTKRGLEDLLRFSPSGPVEKVIPAYIEYEEAYQDYLESKAEDLYGAGWL